MKRTFGYWWLAALALVAVALGLISQRQQPETPFPRARFADYKPLGGKGLRLLLQKQGYTVKRQAEPLKAIPKDAKVWLMLDPQTRISQTDAKVLLQWVKDGGVLVWSNLRPSFHEANWWEQQKPKDGMNYFREKLHLSKTQIKPHFLDTEKSLLPMLEPVRNSTKIGRSGAHNLSISPNTFLIDAEHQTLIGSQKGLKLAVMTHGQGQVIISADALLFTNYALAQGDNAALVSHLIRKDVTPGAGIYFDERTELQMPPRALPHTLLYYLWQPPLRWAMLQLLFAGLLLWMFYGRRLGRPTPIPVQQPVTRASQFGVAMAGLYQKARRPNVPLTILGKEFKRVVIRRTGASPLDDNATLAARCSEVSGLPREQIFQLLEQMEQTSHSESEVLRMTREMEEIQRQLGEPNNDRI